jgi:hypothetical protein
LHRTTGLRLGLPAGRVSHSATARLWRVVWRGADRIPDAPRLKGPRRSPAAGLFLVVYGIRWAVLGSEPSEGTGWIRALYLVALVTHVILATALAPMVLVTLRRGLAAEYAGHKRIHEQGPAPVAIRSCKRVADLRDVVLVAAGLQALRRDVQPCSGTRSVAPSEADDTSAA